MLVAVQVFVVELNLPPVLKLPRPPPDNHFSARPDCSVIFAALRGIRNTCSCPDGLYRGCIYRRC